VIKTADCQPVLLAHPGPAALRGPKIAVSPAFAGPFSAPGLPGQEITMTGPVVAALHVGWRGNAADFPGSGVARFCARYGLDPGEVLAVRGPSLGPTAAEFTNFESEFGEDFRPWYDPATRTMDLWGLTRHQLEQAGIRPRNIFAVDLCTHTMSDWFFSYRRAKVTGRQASVIWIR